MNIEQKISYYKKNKQCITFEYLYSAVSGVCGFIKPIYQNIELLKYFEYFFENIDFDKIDENDKIKQPTKKEKSKYCDAIYYGLEKILKKDIDDAIQNYQINILQFTKENKAQKEIIRFIGYLKRQTETYRKEISYTQYYDELYEEINTGKLLKPIDYKELIGHFDATILNFILGGYIEIDETLNKLSAIASNAEKPINNTLYGFQSSLTPLQIDALFKQFKGIYINNETIPEYFKSIFRNEPLPLGFIPIKKLKKFTTVLLAYFVSEVFQKENPTNYWSIAENCFNVKNLRQSLNNAYQFNPNHKPKGYEEIDTIIKNIYTPLQ